MTIDNTDLQQFVYNPGLTQSRVLDYLDLATNGNVVIGEPANPFVFLMETAVQTATNSLLGTDYLLKKKFPALSVDSNDMYSFFTDDDIGMLFSTPAVGVFTLYVNLTDLRNMGVRSSDGTYLYCTIPENTTVAVDDLNFTLFNSIDVRFFDDGNREVEMLSTTNPLGFSNIGLLSSEVLTDSDNTIWIAFSLHILQYRAGKYNKTIVTTAGFDFTHKLTDSFSTITVSYSNSSTGGLFKKMKVTYTEDMLDVYTPTAVISVKNGNVYVRIPSIYTLDGTVSGSVSITVYETKGAVYRPLDVYPITSFTLTKGSTYSTPSTAAITNITLLASGAGPVTGGSSGLSLANMSTKVRDNLVGKPQYPISANGIAIDASLDGFELIERNSTLIDRSFYVFGALPTVRTANIKANTYVVYARMTANSNNNMSLLDYNNSLVIRPGTIFEVIDSVVNIVDDTTASRLFALGGERLINFIGNRSFLVAPLLQVCDADYVTSEMRLYSVSTPTIPSSRIVDKNRNLKVNLNSQSYVVHQTSTGYRLYITVIGNSEYDAISDKSTIRCQIKLTSASGDASIYYSGGYLNSSGMIEVEISTDFYVDTTDNIVLTGGLSDLARFSIPLRTTCSVIIYSRSSSITDTKNYRTDAIINRSADDVFITEENISLSIGSRVNNFTSDVFTYYNDYKYKRYETDIPLRYVNDVYDNNPANGTVFFTENLSGNCAVTTKTLHTKGTSVTDTNGDVVYLYRAGDIQLDSNGDPIIDTENGISRVMDILTLNAEYYLATNQAHVNYFDTVTTLLSAWDSGVLQNINNKLLENTTAKYMSYNKSSPVTVKNETGMFNIPYVVTPKVVVYRDYTNFNSDTVRRITDISVDTICSYLKNTTINVIELNQQLLSLMPAGILAVRVENIDPVNNSQFFTITSTERRLMLGSKLYVDEIGTLSVKYDVDVVIVSLT